jgi:hypothetical protein
LTGFFGETVDDAFAGAPILDQAASLELSQLGGDAGLPHGKDLLEFSDGEILAAEKAEDAKPGWIGEAAQRIYD